MTSRGYSGLRVTAVARIDVTSHDALLAVDELRTLAPHSRVIVDVSDRDHHDDPRVVEFLAQYASELALHIEVHGRLHAVREWTAALHRCVPTPPDRGSSLRHLTPVDGGDPA